MYCFLGGVVIGGASEGGFGVNVLSIEFLSMPFSQDL